MWGFRVTRCTLEPLIGPEPSVGMCGWRMYDGVLRGGRPFNFMDELYRQLFTMGLLPDIFFVGCETEEGHPFFF